MKKKEKVFKIHQDLTVMNEYIRKILMKVIPKIKENPEIMKGYDISAEELSYIVETGRLPLEVLSNVAGDIFFFMEYEKLGISEKEAKDIRDYLIFEAKKDFEELRKMFPFIELKMKKED